METGKQSFKSGDRVVCIDNEEGYSAITKGEEYIIDEIDDGYVYLKDREDFNGGFYPSRFKLVEPDFQHKYFSALNVREADEHIGKVMEFADVVRLKENNWAKSVLWPFTENYLGNYLFNSKDGGEYQFMRTCPETFNKDNSGLIEAVKKSIKHWELIRDTGKTKEEVYEFLGGEREKWSCFLCDYTGYDNDSCDKDNCSKCIGWGEFKTCHDSMNTVWNLWRQNKKSPQRIKAMIDHLKAELKNWRVYE